MQLATWESVCTILSASIVFCLAIDMLSVMSTLCKVGAHGYQARLKNSCSQFSSDFFWGGG